MTNMTDMAMLEKYAGKKRKRGYTKQGVRNFGYMLTSFSEQHGLCFWCHEPMEQPEAGFNGVGPRRATCEHLVRLADGGRNSFWNIVAAHSLCNNRRDCDVPGTKGKKT
jgi:hypothetical protein